jgi:mRNA interferase YafQ
MRRIEHTNQFKRDFRRERRGRHRAMLETSLPDLVEQLAADEPLAPALRDHALAGNWSGFRDCHIRPDLVLIYQKTGDALRLIRLGSHAELFE